MAVMNALLLLLILFAPTTAWADWSPHIICNDRALVVDRRITRGPSGKEAVEYQIVVHDPRAIAYLRDYAHLENYLNQKNELILPSLTSPSEGVFTGGPNPYYTFFLDHGGGTLSVSRGEYYTRVINELAHWYFDRCDVL